MFTKSAAGMVSKTHYPDTVLLKMLRTYPYVKIQFCVGIKVFHFEQPLHKRVKFKYENWGNKIAYFELKSFAR